jgi:hypothetical protein
LIIHGQLLLSQLPNFEDFELTRPDGLTLAFVIRGGRLGGNRVLRFLGQLVPSFLIG